MQAPARHGCAMRRHNPIMSPQTAPKPVMHLHSNPVDMPDKSQHDPKTPPGITPPHHTAAPNTKPSLPCCPVYIIVRSHVTWITSGPRLPGRHRPDTEHGYRVDIGPIPSRRRPGGSPQIAEPSDRRRIDIDPMPSASDQYRADADPTASAIRVCFRCLNIVVF
jgi:hypothetical protein